MTDKSDVNVRAILWFGIGFVLVGVAIYVIVWLLFGYFTSREAVASGRGREYPLAAAEEARLPPEPRLQSNPREDLRDLREHEEQLLHSYQWVDRSEGIVRLPIEQAMRLTLERGLPARAKVDAR